MNILPIDLGLYENTYSLNFHSHFKDIIEFTRASWNLSAIFIKSVTSTKSGEKSEKLTSKQKVSILLLTKSQRLLRTISLLASSGYWPEAEIIYRSMFETEALFTYILQDPTEKRAISWLSRKSGKERWPMSVLINNIETHKNLYESLSLYPHNHVLSTSHYVQFIDNKIQLESGPLGGDKNNEKAKKVLGIASMMNAGLCELATSQFSQLEDYSKAHSDLMKTSYYISQQENVQKFISRQENLDILSKKIPNLK